MDSKHYFSLFLSFFFLLTSFSLPTISPFVLPVSAYDYRREIEIDFHLDSSYPKEDKLFTSHADNDALVNFIVHLFDNSTNNVTVLIEPEEEWNVTHIPVNIGQTVNVTVTNGEVIDPYPNDVASYFKIFIQRENVSDEVWGHLFIGIITYGWSPASWPFVSVILGVLVLVSRRFKKRK